MAGQLGVSLDRESIRNLTTRKYREVVKALSEEVDKKLIFLKVKTYVFGERLLPGVLGDLTILYTEKTI